MLKCELKKVFSKTVNKVMIIAVIFIAVILSFLAAGSILYTDTKGESASGISKITAGRRLAEDKNQWKGVLTAEKIAGLAQDYHELKQKYPEQQYPQGIPDEEYGGTVQSRWDILEFAARVYTTESDFYDVSRLAEEDLTHIYDTYTDNLRKMEKEYGETPEQEEFLREQSGKIKVPFTYEAYDSWDTMAMYVQTYVVVLAIAIGFLAAGIFDEEFRNHAELVYFASKYGRTKATVNKIAAGMITATIVYWLGIGVLSLASFVIMGVSGFDTPYQILEPYSVYVITQGQRYLLIVICGYIASLLAASVTMLVTAKTHNEKVAVCIPFFMYFVMLFIAGALSDVTKIVYFTPDVLVNILRALRTLHFFQFGNVIFLQVPFVMALYFVISLILLPFIYGGYSRYGLEKEAEATPRKERLVRKKMA